MLKKITLLAVMVLFSFQAFGQLNPKLKVKIKDIDGTEMGMSTNVVSPKTTSDVYLPVSSPLATFTFSPTGVLTGYDLEGNGSTQQIWQDPSHPDTIHTVYMTSQQTTGWSDRGSTYIVSFDRGLTWTNYGNVPAGIRTGYPSISGLPSGRAIIGSHLGTNGVVYVDEGPAAGNFTAYNPGADSGAIIWLRVLGVSETKVAFAGAINATLGRTWHNTLNLPAGTFTGFHQVPESGTAEQYHLAKSDDGSVVGIAWLGEGTDVDGDVFYAESNDGGVTWSNPLKIWNLDTTSGTLGMKNYGPIRGIELTFLQTTPYVVFELGQQDVVAGSYFPGAPAFIALWSPELTGDSVKILADTNNVIEYASLTGANDVMFPICRPVIGHSADGNALFVAFHGASEFAMGSTSADSTSYFDGYFMSSTDKGVTWTSPVIFTPRAPLRDWRYPSITPIVPRVGDNYVVQMMIQSDSIPGSTVNAIAGFPVGVTAEFIGVTASVLGPTGVNDGVNTPTKFSLSQNYPNPFNPSTKIKYSVPERSNVTLKVFDVLGREVAVLVNETKGAGSYEANFDASKLSSGLYVYQLTAGSNTISKKMMLLK